MRSITFISIKSFRSRRSCNEKLLIPSSSSPSSLYSTSSILSTSINSALRILNLHHKPNYNPKELRDAYFSAAMLCHPDTKKKNHQRNADDSTIQFLELTEAYEILQQTINNRRKNNNTATTTTANNNEDTFIIHKSEEEHFRAACREKLGLDAETVEESKKCPLFREWLKGKTDAAFHWNNFFMLHGGLAPMLNNKRILKLSEGIDGRGGSGGSINGNGRFRRRRKR